MAILQSGDSPGTRIAAGDSVIDGAKGVNTAPIKKRLAAFKAIHGQYGRADRAVKKASQALQAQQAVVGAADVDQDSSVLELASALPADGLSRLNPFKDFGAPAPAMLCSMGYEAEAKEVLALETAVSKRKGLSTSSITLAKAAGKAARRVQAALAPIAKLEKARTVAMGRRDALAQAWETAFAGLKRGARAAEDEGSKGLFAALFERKATKAGSKRSKAKKGKTAPEGAPPVEG
jgi:hypothetical protein